MRIFKNFILIALLFVGFASCEEEVDVNDPTVPGISVSDQELILGIGQNYDGLVGAIEDKSFELFTVTKSKAIEDIQLSFAAANSSEELQSYKAANPNNDAVVLLPAANYTVGTAATISKGAKMSTPANVGFKALKALDAGKYLLVVKLTATNAKMPTKVTAYYTVTISESDQIVIVTGETNLTNDIFAPTDLTLTLKSTVSAAAMNDISSAYKIDVAAIDAYKTANPTEADKILLLPSANRSIAPISLTSNIKMGETEGTPITINLSNLGYLDGTKTYLLPLTIKETNAIEPVQKTIYYKLTFTNSTPVFEFSDLLVKIDGTKGEEDSKEFTFTTTGEIKAFSNLKVKFDATPAQLIAYKAKYPTGAGTVLLTDNNYRGEGFMMTFGIGAKETSKAKVEFFNLMALEVGTTYVLPLTIDSYDEKNITPSTDISERTLFFEVTATPRPEGAVQAPDLRGVNIKMDFTTISEKVNNMSALTFETWVYSTNWAANTATGNKLGTIFGGIGGGPRSVVIRMGDGGWAANQLQLAIEKKSWGGTESATDHWPDQYSDTRIPANEWVHIAVVHNVGGDNRLYVNGVLKEDGTNTNNANIQFMKDDKYFGYIGMDYSNDRWFPGAMKDYRIWNVERTAEQIKAHMYTPVNVTTDVNKDNLIVYIKMDEGMGNDIVDSSPNSVPLTIGKSTGGQGGSGNLVWGFYDALPAK